jgi:hypothetical protein
MARRLDWEAARKRDYMHTNGTVPYWRDLLAAESLPQPAEVKVRRPRRTRRSGTVDLSAEIRGRKLHARWHPERGIQQWILEVMPRRGSFGFVVKRYLPADVTQATIGNLDRGQAPYRVRLLGIRSGTAVLLAVLDDVAVPQDVIVTSFRKDPGSIPKPSSRRRRTREFTRDELMEAIRNTEAGGCRPRASFWRG